MAAQSIPPTQIQNSGSRRPSRALPTSCRPGCCTAAASRCALELVTLNQPSRRLSELQNKLAALGGQGRTKKAGLIPQLRRWCAAAEAGNELCSRANACGPAYFWFGALHGSVQTFLGVPTSFGVLAHKLGAKSASTPPRAGDTR